MKLFYSPGACSLAPHIALREAGLSFDMDKVDLKNKTTGSGASFLKISPRGYVPALQLDNGQVLSEGAVILQYIAELKPTANLMPPAGTMERWRAMEWLNFIASEVHKGFSPLWDSTNPPEIKQKATERLFKRFDVLSEQLAGNEWLMGKQYTVADSYLFTVMSWAGMLKMDISRWAALTAHIERVKARPAVQAALKAEGLLK